MARYEIDCPASLPILTLAVSWVRNDPLLNHLIHLLKDELNDDERALFRELAEVDLDGLTAALNEQLCAEEPAGSTAEVLERVRTALAKASQL